MKSRHQRGRILAILGSVVLLASALLHCLAYAKISSPSVGASNLSPELKSVFGIAFLSMAWNWVVLAVIVLVVTSGTTAVRKAVVVICGFAVLVQAAVTVPFVGLFLGNEMIGAASLLIIIGGFLLHRPVPDGPEPY